MGLRPMLQDWRPWASPQPQRFFGDNRGSVVRVVAYPGTDA
jgi:hypothetical protein